MTTRAPSPAPAPSSLPGPWHIAWVKGGHARVASIAVDAIVLSSTIPSPPGSRLEGRLLVEAGATAATGATGATGETAATSATIRVKIHGSKRQPDGAFILEGRVLDATREVRARLALAGAAAG